MTRIIGEMCALSRMTCCFFCSFATDQPGHGLGVGSRPRIAEALKSRMRFEASTCASFPRDAYCASGTSPLPWPGGPGASCG